MISGDLARLYENAYNVSNEAARKAISRAKAPVKKYYKLKFDKNQLFYCLESQFMTEKYKHTLLSAIEQHSRVNPTVYTGVYCAKWIRIKKITSFVCWLTYREKLKAIKCIPLYYRKV